jgi:hypothetical protein
VVCCFALFSRAQADSAAEGEDSSLVVVERLHFNSPQSDFAPYRSGKKLYFISGRINKVGVQYTDEREQSEITDIYEATVTEQNRVRAIRPVKSLNSRYYEGPLSMSRDGQRMYLTGNDRKAKQLKIYYSDLRAGQWSPPRPMSFCNDSFAYCHPAIAPTEDTLYFSSNCCGSGKMDICYSILREGTWSRPTSLASHVNSPSNELFPYLSADNRLYFASDRAGGIGGLDLYRAAVLDTVRRAELLYPPLNSPSDDFGIWTDSTGQSGYFSTNRSPRTGDDIYSFSRSIPDFSSSELPPVRTRFCYTFYEENSMSGNDTADLTYEWRFGDGTSARGLSTRHCYLKPGAYDVELNVVQKSSGQVDTSLVKYRIDIEEPEQLRISCPDTVMAGEPVTFSSEGSSLRGFEITSRYWAFGDGFYNRGTEARHQFRREGKYVVELWVVASGTQDHKTHKFRMTKEIVVK